MLTRHQFLARLHKELQPRAYLEIGVFQGDSLMLAQCPAIGVDPTPHVGRGLPATTAIVPATSDAFFEASILSHQIGSYVGSHLDLVFIDGMHLYEFALRDFQNCEEYANPRTVIVFDDVLPRNQHEAARQQCPGDWTGDVWKTARLIHNFRRDLKSYWVNTAPTGTFVVYGFQPDVKHQNIYSLIEHMGLEAWETVPDDVINRADAVEPDWVLEQLAAYMSELATQESG